MSDIDLKTQKSWQLIEKLVLQNSRTLQKQQRWAIFFKLLFFFYLGLLIWLLWPSQPNESLTSASGDQIAMVSVNGIIRSDGEASAAVINTGLRKAFESDSKTVMLKINSPGGSPVQAGQVYREIGYLKKQHPDTKVVAVITDVGASGAYYIAAAADQIYADRASIVGSIGVIMEGFGFEGTMKKLGVERRVLTAGDNKDILDPFSPVTKQQKAFVKTMLDEIHQQFIEAVKQGRGDRLHYQDNPDIFSGLFWTGEQALKLGIIDGLGSPMSVARELTDGENIKDFTAYPNRIEKLMQRFGVSIGRSAAKTLGVESQIPGIH